jgi:hypothetical protein
MRTLLSLLCGALLSVSVPQAHAQSTTTEAEPDCREYHANGRLKQPGDYGYGHRCLHPHYQKLYSSGKCHCHTGACRPTVFRTRREKTGEVVREVLIDRHWYTFDEATRRHKNAVPEALWSQDGHVCAMPTGKFLPDGRPEQNIECTLDIGSS